MWALKRLLLGWATIIGFLAVTGGIGLLAIQFPVVMTVIGIVLVGSLFAFAIGCMIKEDSSDGYHY